MEESTEASKKALKTYIASDRELGARMNLDAIGLQESDTEAITALKEISEKQEEYLPVVQGRVVATGTKEDIFIIRDLLTSHGVEIRQFPEVPANSARLCVCVCVCVCARAHVRDRYLSIHTFAHTFMHRCAGKSRACSSSWRC